MKYSFDPKARLIKIPVELTGPWGSFEFIFALDTAASRTCVSEIALRRIGIRTEHLQKPNVVHGVNTDSHFGMVGLDLVKALGVSKKSFEVAFTQLNPASKIHGLLGLDFFRGRILTVDFVRGTVVLVRPWRRLFRR